MKAVKTLVLLANDENARLVQNVGVGHGLTEVGTLAASDFADVDAEYADQKGRSQGSPGMAHHAVEPSTSIERQERQAFARHVLAEAQTQFAKGYDRFALVAAPRMLGELRDHLPKTLKGALLFDLAKDLVHTSERDLPKALADKAAF